MWIFVIEVGYSWLKVVGGGCIRLSVDWEIKSGEIEWESIFVEIDVCSFYGS